MPKLKVDFFADWIELLRTHLIDVQKWPSNEILKLSDADISHYFFDAHLRRIASIPRAIEIGDNFACSPAHEAGWAILQEKVRKGEDINSYLSKNHASLYNHDGLLAEWGVHHFHLGAAPSLKNPAYMDRTGPLLYAIVGDEVFYAINVYDHQSFEKIDIIESIHRNWPEIVRCYRVKGDTTGSMWDEEKRKALRKINVNLRTTVSDGTVYMPISGGVMMSGINARAVRVGDYWRLKVQKFQSSCEEQFAKFLPNLMENGYNGEDTIEATLQSITEDEAKVLFPKYGLNVTVVFDQSA